MLPGISFKHSGMSETAEPAMPLFITGLPRSGTTLVRLLFHKHPDIAIPHETGIVRKVYEKRWQMRLSGFRASHYGNLSETLGPSVVEAFDKWPLSSRNKPFKVLNGLMSLYAEYLGKKYWGEKTPTNFRNIEFIKGLFPNSTVLFVLRDPKAVFASRKRYLMQKRAGKDFWMTNDLKAVVEEFKEAFEKIMENESYFKILSYEALVKNPEGILKGLFEEIGLTYYSEVLNFYQIAEEAIPANTNGGLNPWHQTTRNPIDPANIGKWREELSSQEIQKIDEETGNLKARLLA